MNRLSHASDSVGLTLTFLLFLAMLVASTTALAGAKTVAIEGISYNVNSSLNENMAALIGKQVSVTLNSGKTFVGLVKAVGSHLVHLEKLDGKEYYDALIKMEDIGAIDTRFRKMER